MIQRTRFNLGCLAAAIFLMGPLRAQEIAAIPQHSTGLYAAGEKIGWRVEIRGAVPPPAAIHYTIKKNGGALIGQGDLPLTDGIGALETSLDEPGTVLVNLQATVGERTVKIVVGAAVNPEKIQPSAPPPPDFADFWKARIAELNAIPANPMVQPADSGSPDVEYDKVQLDNIHGAHVYGQLARPKREGKYPAMLLVQYAGVYGLPKSNVVNPAREGWLALNIMAHDLRFDQPADFYTQAAATTLKDYVTIGAADPNTSYFLRMLLGCYRATDYLANRPDWDGRTLIVTGTSQGGLQSFATACLYPKITAMLVNVPAGCDATGPRAGRAVSWPYWYATAKTGDEKKIMETSRYFDNVNFATNIHCPCLVALGLIDQTSVPSGVFTAFNQIKGPKEVVVMVNSEHKGVGNSQQLWYTRSRAWLKALVHGNPPPIQALGGG